MIISLIKEYGLTWLFNRALYSTKLKMLKIIPIAEGLFEKKVDIKRIDIFDIDITRLENFLYKLPEVSKEEIIKIADNAVEGKINGFSSMELDYGNPIDWHFSPFTKKKVNKNIKWFQISDFDTERGDIKAIWEISRFTHFFYLSRAYMLTKDIKYYNAFSIQLKDWLKENKYSYGANYKCGQEATLRMINTLMIYSVFKTYDLITKEDEKNIKKLVEGSYKKVISNFFYAHKCIKNNHTISEITGLIIGSWCSIDDMALERSYKLLDKEIENQFLKDGGYIQFSFNYQRFALQIMEFIFKIGHKTKKNISEDSIKLIEKSIYQMYQLQDETGDLPNYGSNDGALIFPVTIYGYRDFRPVINTLYSIIKGKRLFEPSYYDEEILWFSNYDLDELLISEIPKEPIEFKDTGLYKLSHDKGFLMIILQDFKTRPSQMDQLHIDLWHKDINVFCDSGTYSYATDIGKQMALTSAHNTVKVEDKEQMNKHGPFLMYDWTKSKDIEFGLNKFGGTMVSKNGYWHRREITKDSEGYFLIDSVGEDIKNFDILFHTPCEVKKKEYGIDLIYNKEIIAKIFSDNEIEVKEGYRSLYYLQTEKTNRIVIKNNQKNIVETKIILMD